MKKCVLQHFLKLCTLVEKVMYCLKIAQLYLCLLHRERFSIMPMAHMPRSSLWSSAQLSQGGTVSTEQWRASLLKSQYLECTAPQPAHQHLLLEIVIRDRFLRSSCCQSQVYSQNCGLWAGAKVKWSVVYQDLYKLGIWMHCLMIKGLMGLKGWPLVLHTQQVYPLNLYRGLKEHR